MQFLIEPFSLRYLRSTFILCSNFKFSGVKFMKSIHFPERCSASTHADINFTCPILRKVTVPPVYSIEYCPICFHDLLEIFDFLINLSPVYLYQYQFQNILFNGLPIMYIIITYMDGAYYVSYRCI